MTILWIYWKGTGEMKSGPFAKEVKEGEELDRFYGISWRDYGTKTTISHPIPLNRIFAWVRRHWSSLKYRLPKQTTQDLQEKELNMDSWKRGWEAGSRFFIDEVLSDPNQVNDQGIIAISYLIRNELHKVDENLTVKELITLLDEKL